MATEESLKKENENGNSIHRNVTGRSLEPNEINVSDRITDALRIQGQGLQQAFASARLEEQSGLRSGLERLKTTLRNGLEKIRDKVNIIAERVETIDFKREIKPQQDLKFRLEKEKEQRRGGPGMGFDR